MDARSYTAQSTNETSLSIDYSDAKGSTGPFSRFERMLAVRYLRARRKEAFISVIAGFSFLGIMLGVATLIVVMAVMNGFRADLFDRIIGLNGHVMAQPIDGELIDYDAVAQRISGVEGVKYAIPLVDGQVLASNGPGGTGAFVRGMAEAGLRNLKSVSDNLEQGTLDGFDDPEDPGVIIGVGMANKLGLRLGERIRLISPEGNVTPLGVTPRVKAYPVKAIFKMGMSEYDSSIIFMPLVESQLYFNLEDTVSVIEIFTDDPDAVDALRDPIIAASERPIYVTDWRQRHSSFFQALEVERNVMFMILTLIVIVAAFNVISGLIMLVKDKSRDIAILRTMGASRSAILRVFLMTGSAIGIAGTLAGFVLGVVVCLNVQSIQSFISWATGTQFWDPTVRFLTEIPADMDPGETVSILVMAIGLSFLATVFPAWRAANIDPVEALRYE